MNQPANPTSRPRTLGEFWPDYVRAHSHPWTRRMHFIGNTNLLIWLAAAALRRRPALVPIGVATSYGLAWIGHFCIERNVPATFKYPILSAFGDLAMYAKMWRGSMDAEVERHAPPAGRG